MNVDASARPEARYAGSSTRAWLAVLVLMLLYTSSFIDRQIIGLMVGPIRRDLGLSDTGISLLQGPAFAIFYSTLALPIGWLVDRTHRARLIAAGAALWSVMTAACGLVGSFTGLFFARIGVGVGEATLSPGAYSIISDYFPAQQRARALSVYGLGVLIGSGLAYIVGGYVVRTATESHLTTLPLLGMNLYPWQLVFLAVGTPGLLLSALVLLVREPARRTPLISGTGGSELATGGVWSQLRRHRVAYATHFLAFGAFSMFAFGAAAWLPSFFIRVHGVPIQEVGLIVGSGTLTFGVAGMLLSGWITDRMVERGNSAAPYTVCAVIGLLGMISVVTAVSMPNARLAFAATLAFTAFGGSWNGIAAAALQTMTPDNMRGQISAAYLLVVNVLGLGVGPIAVALATDKLFHSDASVGWAIALVAVIGISTGVVLLLAGRNSYLRALRASVEPLTSANHSLS